MKKIFCLIAAFILFTGCDDGDMTFQTFNFSEDDPTLCNEEDNTYISINDSEVLILHFPDDALLNIVAENGDPVTNTITFSNGELEYLVYNGTPTVAKICGNLDDPTISVKEYWSGSGTMEIVTSRTINATTRVITYEHSINITDVSFTKGDETIRIQDNYLGKITRNVNVDFDFGGDDEEEPQTLNSCELNTNRKYLPTGNEVIVLDFEQGAFGTDPVKTIQLDDDENNFITVKKYTGTGIGGDAICNSNYPITPTEVIRWLAEEGTVVITRSVNGSDVYYDVYLAIDVRFYNATQGNGEYFNVIPNFPDSTGAYADYYYLGRYLE